MSDGHPAFDTAACVARVRDQNEAAASELFQYLYPLVARRVRAYRPRGMGEDDLCQMVMIKVFTNLDQYAGMVPLEHWVSRIAVNTCLKQLRKEKLRPEFRWSDLRDEEREVIEKLLTSGELSGSNNKIIAKELVSHLLAQLEPSDRLVITLRYLESHSIDEIKNLTGWSNALVKVRAFRARQKLKVLFERLIQKEAEL